MAPSSRATPECFQGDSGASTPSTQDGSSPLQLTPRSKIRALTDAIDNVGDSASDIEDPVAGDLRAREGRAGLSHMSTMRPTNNLLHGQVNEAPVLADKELSTPSDDEEEVIAAQPRGRLARRMQTQTQLDETETESEDDGNAYERVRKQLLGISSNAGKQETEVKAGEDCDASSEQGLAVGIVDTAPPSPGSRRPSPGQFNSPGSSPTRQGSAAPAANGDGSDVPGGGQIKPRFLALVQKKRAEREAREAEATRRKNEKQAQLNELQKARHQSAVPRDDSDVDSIEENRLTQHARPVRKASKKALEEMNRETQRISRNMQLAHQAKTRKKIPKQSLFDRFNYKPIGYEAEVIDEEPGKVDGSSSAAASDTEIVKSTPPTSPAVLEDESSEKLKSRAGEMTSKEEPIAIAGPTSPVLFDNQELPTMGAVISWSPVNGKPSERSAGQSRPSSSGNNVILDKGKAKAVESMLGERVTPVTKSKSSKTERQFRIRSLLRANAQHAGDSDSDLEIIKPSKAKKPSIWQKMPEMQISQSHPLQNLRTLANLTSPGKRQVAKGASMSVTELQAHLQHQARQQAARERSDRVQELKDSGVIVQTSEERAKCAAEIEDLLANARKEADEMKKRERAASKKNGESHQDTDDEGEYSGEDADWSEGDDEEEQSGSEVIENSGEEEEEGEGEEEEEEGEEDNALIEEQAEEDPNSSELEEQKIAALTTSNGTATVMQEDEASEESPEKQQDRKEELESREPVLVPSRRRRRHARILSDDDEEDATEVPSPGVLKTPRSVRKPTIPGLPMAAPPPLGLTQIFAGTMVGSQPNSTEHITANDNMDQEQDSLAFLRQLPVQTLPDFDTEMTAGSQEVVKDSQKDPNQPDTQMISQSGTAMDEIDLHYSQSQIQEDTLLEKYPLPDATQISEFPDPTQDAGFTKLSPLRDRFAEPPPSTVETVLLDNNPTSDNAIPKPKKKGRLRPRIEARVFSDEEDGAPANNAEEDDPETSANVFDVMRKASKTKPVEEEESFDKTKSKAKGMVEEQAEESEDEYAGLGGASDDSGDDEADAEMLKEMVDDGAQDVDEREIAAFSALKERADDEKHVEKLFKDITNGMLRRNRGADYDLSDSDDGGEARRRMKRRDFAKMRKALLQDENLGKIATNPKKLAFLRAIEDHDEAGQGPELDFLNDNFQAASEDPMLLDSQSTEAGPSQSENQPQGGPLKTGSLSPTSRKRKQAPAENDENRPPPDLCERRPNATRKKKKPSTLSEIRESLSTLIDAPNAILSRATGDGDSSSSSDNDNDNDNPSHNHSNTKPEPPKTHTHQNPRRRTAAAAAKTNAPAVIDRLSLKRASSNSSLGEPESRNRGSGRLAFYASSINSTTTTTNTTNSGGSGGTGGFRVPSLLRRATTSNLGTAATTTTTTTSSGSATNDPGSAAAAAAAAAATLAALESIRRSSTGASGSGSRSGSGSGVGASSLSSSVNAFARKREKEDGKVLMEREERRRRGMIRKVGEGRDGVLAGLAGGGGGGGGGGGRSYSDGGDGGGGGGARGGGAWGV
ncbi:MAG: hypothetical protein M1837_000007 [Sclerophora amabilis]|nr:MAG: hypothetical protein M1837_000007 [Sclerophora amabilis]